MPIIIIFGDKTPLIIKEFHGYLEDIHPEYSIELPDDNPTEDTQPFQFTPSPLW